MRLWIGNIFYFKNKHAENNFLKTGIFPIYTEGKFLGLFLIKFGIFLGKLEPINRPCASEYFRQL
jgi:hypothetical protein